MATQAVTRRLDLTDEQWARLEPLLPVPTRSGRPSPWTKRQTNNNTPRTAAAEAAALPGSARTTTEHGTPSNAEPTELDRVGVAQGSGGVLILSGLQGPAWARAGEAPCRHRPYAHRYIPTAVAGALGVPVRLRQAG
ncbi:hypothetical protein CDO52_17120 [Nocardiopsis gilva YIM 90087]|uniref:ASD1 domain-containing protein n=1 Tax=Nocardiopsis gilva YIM 90087 TaxID=1235441 RepID=A0A223S853_9ACTN|nr:hypothetical protein CDO52_17120 [Nocardiopsis gilva YIM 90087]